MWNKAPPPFFLAAGEREGKVGRRISRKFFVATVLIDEISKEKEKKGLYPDYMRARRAGLRDIVNVYICMYSTVPATYPGGPIYVLPLIFYSSQGPGPHLRLGKSKRKQSARKPLDILDAESAILMLPSYRRAFSTIAEGCRVGLSKRLCGGWLISWLSGTPLPDIRQAGRKK